MRPSLLSCLKTSRGILDSTTRKFHQSRKQVRVDVCLKKDAMDDQTFTFVWEINNFPLCRHREGEVMKSKRFVARILGDMEWSCYFYPKHVEEPEFVSFYILKYTHLGLESSALKATLQLVATNGKPRNMLTPTEDIADDVFPFPRFASRRDLERFYLHKNDLRMQCVLSKVGKETAMKRVFACTSAVVHRVCRKWSLTNFSRVERGKVLEESVMFPPGGLFDVCMFIEGKPDRKAMIIQFIRRDDSPKNPLILNARIAVLDSNWKESEIWKRDQYTFRMPTPREVWQFPTFIAKDVLMRNKKKYLVDNVLQLKCEVFVSSGERTSKIASYSTFSEEVGNTQFVEKLSEHIKDLYNVKRFADVKLRVGTETVPAHRIVLKSRSRWFAEMLDAEREDDGVLDVPDVDAVTLKRMLKYMYTDEFDHLEYDDAVVAYISAHKFGIESLKCKYSFALQSQLQLNNVCRILILSHEFCDQGLKKCAIGFMKQYWECVGSSKEFEELSKERKLLAREAKERVIPQCVILSNRK